ncbi:MAG: sel1 repeat family protein [Lentisphaeria bacterium]|nr:MAG: sel1 repeat family protein [Lentisphaeria bacterium]
MNSWRATRCRAGSKNSPPRWRRSGRRSPNSRRPNKPAFPKNGGNAEHPEPPVRTLRIAVLFVSFCRGGRAPAGPAARPRPRGGRWPLSFNWRTNFFFGRNRPRNPTLAAYWFRRAAELGSPEGTYNFAVCLERGWGVPQSENQAFSFYTKAAEAGRPEARMRRARLLYSGVKEEKRETGTRPAIPAEPEKALEELRKLCGENFAPAKFELARLLAGDRERRKSCAGELRARLEEYAAQPNPEPKALLLLAECRRDGVGGSPSMEHAADAVERAMMLGDVDAKALYARILEYGHGRRPAPEQAFRLTKEAAEAGSRPALLRLGDYKLTGEYLPHDPGGAVECFRRAAEAGYPPAFFKLGNAYAEGIGVEKDPVRAFEEFAKGARAGGAALSIPAGALLP